MVRLRAAWVALNRWHVATAPLSEFAEICPKRRKGWGNELPEVATADDGYSVSPFALDWVRCSCSYAHTSAPDSYTHVRPANTYTSATDRDTHAKAQPGETGLCPGR